MFHEKTCSLIWLVDREREGPRKESGEVYQPAAQPGLGSSGFTVKKFLKLLVILEL